MFQLKKTLLITGHKVTFIALDPVVMQHSNEELPELRGVKLILVNTVQNNKIVDGFSIWMKLIRVTGWFVRFIQKTKRKVK